MTGITLVRADDMVRRLARCNRAVVATEAAAGDLGMVDARDRRPVAGAMTGIALIRADDMVRRLARRNRAVVAGETWRSSGEMIEPGHIECPDAVTLAAIQIRRHVVQRLAGRGDAIVADHAARGRAAKNLVAVTVAAD